MKRHALLVLLLLTAASIFGCAQTGVFASANLTEVQLNRGNYRMVATSVSGTATAGYVLGITVPMGMATQTLAVARVQGTGLLYQEALAALWANFESQHGPVGQRRLALVNVRFDSDNTNLLIYAKPRLSVRADVVEFTD